MPSQDIPAQALYNACSTGDLAAVSRLLPGGTTLNLSGPTFRFLGNQSTPLTAAAAGGHADIVRMILKRAPRTAVDHMLATGATALLMAALYHNFDILGILADGGANLNFTNQWRTSALFLAVDILPVAPFRGSDPDGARQIATVRELLRLGAGTLPPGPFPDPPSCKPFLTRLALP
jgi:hypothetical protein